MRYSGGADGVEGAFGEGVGHAFGGMILLPVSATNCLNSGLTRTTPTLTPTTLSSNDPTYMELSEGLVAPPVSHQNQACFVTPQIVSTTAPHEEQPNWPSESMSPALSVSPGPSLPENQPSGGGHRKGGRRPKEDNHLSPEEEHRRYLRRERNKQAAARCRRRRMDLTSSLERETDHLEGQRAKLEQEIRILQAQKDELRYVINAHNNYCKLNRQAKPPPQAIVKLEPEDDGRAGLGPSLETTRNYPARQIRPSSLLLRNLPGSGGAQLNTPSVGMALNFESLMDGGTGLTPMSSGLTPLMNVVTSTSLTSLSTPVHPERSPSELRSPDSGKHLVSL